MAVPPLLSLAAAEQGTGHPSRSQAGRQQGKRLHQV